MRWPRLRIHPLFIAVVGLAFYGHFLGTVGVLFLVVVLHELGHVIAARFLGYETEYIELLPFGGVAKLASGNMGWHPRDETLIAICGPLVNLLLALAAVSWRLLFPVWSVWTHGFVSINLTVLFFNLLPGLPLDGGRIARAGLSLTRGYERATRLVLTMSFYIAGMLVIMGASALWLGYPDAGLLALGVFLLVAAYSLRRHSRYDTLRFLDAKRRERVAKTLPVRLLTAPGATSVGDVAAEFAPGAYHLVYVSRAEGAGGTSMELVEESALLQAIFEEGMWAEPISELL